jgi:hypothetical protein
MTPPKEELIMGYASNPRKDRLIQEKRHDAYQERGKPPAPALCTDCGALFVNGRWSWNKPPKKVNKITCPACRRNADRYPAGHIVIRGSFFETHHDEVWNLIGNVEKQETRERPLERIMSVTRNKDHTLVTTTGIHVARRIGEALSRAYKGNFSFQYGDSAPRIRVHWER